LVDFAVFQPVGLDLAALRLGALGADTRIGSRFGDCLGGGCIDDKFIVLGRHWLLSDYEWLDFGMLVGRQLLIHVQVIARAEKAYAAHLQALIETLFFEQCPDRALHPELKVLPAVVAAWFLEEFRERVGPVTADCGLVYEDAMTFRLGEVEACVG
jgi:hypothetical protein